MFDIHVFIDPSHNNAPENKFPWVEWDSTNSGNPVPPEHYRTRLLELFKRGSAAVTVNPLVFNTIATMVKLEEISDEQVTFIYHGIDGNVSKVPYATSTKTGCKGKCCGKCKV